MTHLSQEDLRQVVHLFGGLAASSRLDERARRYRLLQRLADLIGAELYLWSHIRFADNGSPSTFSCIDGGWASPGQRAHFFELCHDEVVRPAQRELIERSAGAKLTIRRVADLSAFTPEISARCRQVGIDPGLVALYRVKERVYSVVDLHRQTRTGVDERPPMGQREMDLTQLVLGEVEELHASGADLPVADRMDGLTERERTVLMLLLGGESRKQVARRLGLSQYTVADYIQSVYRHYGVSSRAELMSRFLGGQSG